MFIEKLMKCDHKGHYMRVTLQRDLFKDVTVTKSWWGEIKPGGHKVDHFDSEESGIVFIDNLTNKLTRKSRGYRVIAEKIM